MTMTAQAQRDLLLNSDAVCTDGLGGVLRRIVVDPETRRVTHLVVAPEERPDGGHLVPLARVEVLEGQVHLRCTRYELSQLEAAEDTYRMPADAGSAGSADEVAWPYDGLGGGGIGMGVGLDVLDVPRGSALVTQDHVPTGEVQVHTSEQVLGADGVVGRLLGLSMTVADAQVTHLLVGTGHRWHEQHRSIPVSDVLTLDGQVTVRLSRAEVESRAGTSAAAPRTTDVVVGVDGSAAARAALALALLEAAGTGRRVRAVRTWTTPVWLGGAPGAYPVIASSEATQHTARRLLQAEVDEQTQRLSLHPDQVTTQLYEGEAGRRLVQLSQDAGLVVVGGRHRGPLVGALLGSATNYVLHHASCPVMVVPATDTHVTRIGRVLVGVDGSPSSRAALRWGLDAARRHGCGLTAACSYLHTSDASVDLDSPPYLEQAARTWLERQVAEAHPSGVDVRAELLTSSPAWGLLEDARPDDIIVVGNRGRGGFADLVLGSVATQCAQYACGPVVVVRAGWGA